MRVGTPDIDEKTKYIPSRCNAGHISIPAAVLVSSNSNFESKNDMNGNEIGGKLEDNVVQDDGYSGAQTRDPLLFYEEKKSIDQKMEVGIEKFQHESKETDIILQSDKDWFAKR